MSEEEVHSVSREIALLSAVSWEERRAVLLEFLEQSGKPDLLEGGGLERVQSILLSAFGPEGGRRIADRLAKSMNPEAATGSELLRKADPGTLAKVMNSENPQTIALVLCQLDGDQAAQFLRSLPTELRPEVARRAAALDKISPEVLQRVTRSVHVRLRAMGDSPLQAFGGVRVVADLLNRVDPAEAEAILEKINQENPQLDEEIRRLMFVFEDLLKVSPDGVRALMARVDRKILTVALKGSSPQLRKHFMSLMSSRASEMLVEDMQALGPVRIKDVSDAQQKVIATAKQMEAEGQIALRGAGEQEFVE
jgi:flagellar motor switch protein FliG